jgi:hypothetical protein
MKSQLTSTCSAESEDSLLPLDGLDLKQLDSATTNPTPKPSSKSIGQMSQSTETSKHSMARHIEESLFSQEDFPASRSVMPGSGEARTMTAISGRKCSESYKRQGQLGLLVKMLLESSAWHSTKCVLIWKRVDMKSSRSLFQLAVSMPSTEETEYGLLLGGGGDLADSFSMRESQSQGCKQEQREWVGNGCLVLADNYKVSIQPTQTSRDNEKDRKKSNDKFIDRCSSTHRGQGLQANWATEPSVGRVANGVSNRVDRIKGLGNSIVPQVAYQIIKGIAKLVKEKR